MNRGMFISVDGPGGAGKTTVVSLIADILTASGMLVHHTTQPSRTELGDHIRRGTHTYRGMALACLVAGDRHHQLATEIVPALANGAVVLCDRYLPSSLVLQRLDGLSTATVWQLNTGVLEPDTAVLLNGDPEIIGRRLRARGTNSRFEQEPASSHAESRLYHQTAAELADAGWPLLPVDVTATRPEAIAQDIAQHIMTMYEKRSRACPA